MHNKNKGFCLKNPLVFTKVYICMMVKNPVDLNCFLWNLWKIHSTHPRYFFLCIATQNWQCSKRRNIQRQAEAACLPEGCPFYPLSTAETSKLFGRHTSWLKFAACSEAVPCPTIAGFIRAVSQALVTRQCRRAPSGPNQCWGPRERAFKQRHKMMLSNCVVLLQSLSIDHMINSSASYYQFCFLLGWWKGLVLYFFNHRLPVGSIMEMRTFFFFTTPSNDELDYGSYLKQLPSSGSGNQELDVIFCYLVFLNRACLPLPVFTMSHMMQWK